MPAGVRKIPRGSCNETATATVTGRCGPERWSCGSRSCARATPFPAFSRPGGWPRRRSPQGTGGLRPGRLDALGRRPGQGARHERHLLRAKQTRSVESQVSRLCEEIDGRLKAFLDRRLEGDWPYLWIDATYVKARRQDGRGDCQNAWPAPLQFSYAGRFYNAAVKRCSERMARWALALRRLKRRKTLFQLPPPPAGLATARHSTHQIPSRRPGSLL